MVKRKLQLLLPLLLHAAAITSVVSFATPSRASLQKQRSLHQLPVQSRRTATTKLHVATDISTSLDMPELGNDGVYHIMDERQYK